MLLLTSRRLELLMAGYHNIRRLKSSVNTNATATTTKRANVIIILMAFGFVTLASLAFSIHNPTTLQPYLPTFTNNPSTTTTTKMSTVATMRLGAPEHLTWPLTSNTTESQTSDSKKFPRTVSLEDKTIPEWNYGYWLMPREEDAQRLQTLVNQLASEENAIVFQPHLTLCVVPEESVTSSLENVLQQLQQQASGPISLRLKMKEYTGEEEKKEENDNSASYGEKFTQSIFFKFTPTAQLENLFFNSCLSLDISAEKASNMLHNSFMPHVSVLYKDLSMEYRQSLAEHVTLGDQPTITFDRVQLMRMPVTVQEDYQVKAWYPVGPAISLVQ